MPQRSLDVDLLQRTILGALKEVDSVDVVVMSKSTVDEAEINVIEQLLESLGVIVPIADVLQSSSTTGTFPGNWAHIGVNPGLEKGGLTRGAGSESWFHSGRISIAVGHWMKVRSTNITSAGHYNHGFAGGNEARFHPGKIQFVELGDEITLVSLVCEDLAQIDADRRRCEIIRSVGPNVVITPVMDGPQLPS